MRRAALVTALALGATLLPSQALAQPGHHAEQKAVQKPAPEFGLSYLPTDKEIRAAKPGARLIFSERDTMSGYQVSTPKCTQDKTLPATLAYKSWWLNRRGGWDEWQDMRTGVVIVAKFASPRAARAAMAAERAYLASCAEYSLGGNRGTVTVTKLAPHPGGQGRIGRRSTLRNAEGST